MKSIYIYPNNWIMAIGIIAIGLLFLIVTLTSCATLAKNPKKITPLIRLNTIGYLPEAEKKAVIKGECSQFNLIRRADNTIVFSGAAVGPVTSIDTKEEVFLADFTGYKEEGEYYLSVENIGDSAPFFIKKDVYNFAFYTVTRGMYLLRSGIAVSGTHDGITYSHGPSHLEDGYLDYVTGEHIIKDGTGGWYDAGDYGKYVINAGISVGLMGKAWEHFSEKLKGISLDIPESGGPVPDFLEEIRWELDWVMKMQYSDGSGRVSHKLTPLRFSGFVMPEKDTSLRYFTSYSTAATADLVAMCALGSRLFAPYDNTYAEKCLQAARLSYQFLADNPANKDANQSAFDTGTYITSDRDERLWASAEMWETTGEEVYLQNFEKQAEGIFNKFEIDFDWGNVRNLGMLTYLQSRREGKNPELESKIRQSLIEVAEKILQKRNKEAYGRPLERYYWGCNGGVARQTLLLQSAYFLTGKKDYQDTALDAIHHLLGKNYYCRSFVTGLGYKPPMNPHDRRSGADGIKKPWPGYLVGGGHAAKSWLDIELSYDTNEIAINWNTALIYALAGFVE